MNTSQNDYPIVETIHAPYPSFWKDAPKMSIVSYFTSLFRPNQEPTFLSSSYLQPKQYYEYSIELTQSDTSIDRLHIHKIQPKDINQINHFLETHFYSSKDISVKHIYTPIYLYENIVSNQIYGLKLFLDDTLVGVIIARYIGKLNGSHHTSVVSELCIHSSYRKRGYADILLRTLYSYSVSLHSAYIHFFHIDSIFNAPLIAPLNTKSIYGRDNIAIPPYTALQPLTKTDMYVMKESLSSSSKPYIWIEPTILYQNAQSFLCQVIKTQNCFIILRRLHESDSKRGDGAEILFTEGKPEEIDTLLTHTPYGWFESTHAFTSLWKQVGNTLTYAFHLNYGVPSQRDLYYF